MNKGKRNSGFDVKLMWLVSEFLKLSSLYKNDMNRWSINFRPGRSIFIISFLFIIFSSTAVRISAQPSAINFRHIKTEDGLSNSTVETILQDKRGFMWFGTRDGLNRFDGSQMLVYRNEPADSNSLSDNFITSLFEDRDRNLWVGTLNGLNRFEARTNRFFRFRSAGSGNKRPVRVQENEQIAGQNPDSGTRKKQPTLSPKAKRDDTALISSNHITAIYGDSRGRIWIGTAADGINLFQPSNETFRQIACISKENSGTENHILSFLEDSRGNFWAGTQSGLYLYDPNTNQFQAVRMPGEYRQPIASIAQDKNGALLLGFANNGVLVFSPSFNSFQQFLHSAGDRTSLSSNLVRSIRVDKAGGIWIGSVNGGLDHFDAGKGIFTNYQYQPDNPKSLSQRTVSVLYEDRQGNLWIGTHRGGINLYMPGSEKFKLFRQKPFDNSLSYNDVKSFCEDRTGNIWIGTDGGGLNLFDRKQNTFTHFRYEPFNKKSLGSNEVIDIKEDREGNLWIGTWGGGLCLYDRASNNFTRYSSAGAEDQSSTGNYIQCIFEDRDGRMLIGTYYNGLHFLDKKTKRFTRVNTSVSGKSKLNGKNILSIAQDKTGNLWIATDDGGLNMLDAESGEYVHYFIDDDKMPDIRVVFTDSKGNVWAGHTGLYRFNSINKKFELYSRKEDLSTIFIKGIAEDNTGNLWITTSAGLKQLDPETEMIRTYNTGDGLQDIEFEANAIMETRDGQIYIGGVNGFNCFYPNEIRVNNFIPPVYVTNFQVQNRTLTGGLGNKLLPNDISFTEKIILTHKESTFSFGFAALNYTASENNRFAYKLENWDKDWIYSTSEPKASYTNVPPGTYIFKVKASNNDNVWNENGQQITVIITPRFWETWWFRLLIAAGITVAVFYLYRFRKKQQLQKFEEQKKEELHQMQLQFFTNISHELRTPLSLITGPVEKLMKEDAGSRNKHSYQVIQRNANRLLQLIDELMDFRKAESGVLKLQVMPGTVPVFIHEIAEEFSELALQKNIEFTIGAETAIGEVWFDRQVLEKIIINLLSNSFKYTQQNGRVSLQVLDSLDAFRPQYKNELIIGNNQAGGPFIYFRIADNGIGISKESILHLFERYYRVSDTHMGSGIGLAFVKTLTQLHRGNISVYSERNKGTEILVAIPFQKNAYVESQRWIKSNEVAEPLATPAAVDLVSTSPRTTTESKLTVTANKSLILVADDNPELRSFLKETLEEQYRIIEASDGKEALSKTEEFFPDIVISDIMMPGMNGIEYCRHAKENPETAHIPIILLTAKDGIDSRIEGTQTGADHYFSKPIRMELLELTIRNILSQKEKLKDYYRKDVHAEIRDLAHSTKDKQFLQDLITIIEANLAKPEMDIEFVCQQVGMSRTKLYNKIKNITGQPIGDFIRTIRLRKAAALLTEGEYSMLEVMFSVGIQTQSYFSKAFKQEFGKTPTQYVNELESRK